MSTGPTGVTEIAGSELTGALAAMAALGSDGAGDSGAIYLRQVDELRGEIEGAMQAISGNQLGVLEASLWRQQVLCTSLKHLSGTLHSEPATSALRERIREATALLAEVNRTYTHLVQQSAGSVEMMLRLCRSYRGEGETQANEGGRRAWSCEA